MSALRILLLSLVGLGGLTSGQSTWYVSGFAQGPGTGVQGSEFPTITAGIQAASPGDTVIVGQGTYRERVNFDGKDITVRSQVGPEITVIDGEGVRRCVWFLNGETRSAVLDGFKIINGYGESYTAMTTCPEGGGGGIVCVGASPTIQNCQILDCNAGTGATPSGSYASGGGGIAALSGPTGALISDPLVLDCVIARNRTQGFGSNDYNDDGYAGGNGGGVLVGSNNCSMTLVRCRIVDNQTGPGGDAGANGLGYPQGGSGGSGGAGGGVYGNALLLNCIVARNQCGPGGLADPGAPASGYSSGTNGTGGHGGGAAGDATLVHCTVYGNRAGRAGISTSSWGGLLGVDGVGGGLTDCTAYNSIIWGNGKWDGAADQFSGQGTFFDHCAVEGGAPGSGILNADPLLANPAADDFHLCPGSPCMDAGSTGVPNAPATDFEGDNRTVGANPDMGADESTFAPTLLNPANGHRYMLTPSGLSFQQARQFAAEQGGYLVAINDAAEQAFINTNFFSSSAAYYAGLSDEQTEGVWRWDSGEPLTYTNWCANEPSGGTENYLEIVTWLSPSGVPCWNDVADAPGQGIVEIPSGRQAEFRKVMISEVSWGTPDGLEIVNHALTPLDISGWTVRWNTGISTWDSSPLGIVIESGEIVSIGEVAAAYPETPPGIRHIQAFNTLSAYVSGLVVTLIDDSGRAVDEVVISDAQGQDDDLARSGTFRGLVVRTALSPLLGATGVERIWGLDTDSAADWTEQPNRSIGLRNRSSGLRGTDPIPTVPLLINEHDRSYIEFLNSGTTAIDLDGWFVYTIGVGHRIHAQSPLPCAEQLSAGALLLVGDRELAPWGISPNGAPANVAPYHRISRDMRLAVESNEIAVYDKFGRCIDLIRTTGWFNEMVWSQYPAPSYWKDFRGGVRRQPPVASTVRQSANDTNQGNDFGEASVASFGLPNQGGAGVSGLATDLHMVFERPTLGPGAGTVIYNAGPQHAGAAYGLLVSTLPTGGTGPILGLGQDCLSNFIATQGLFPFFGSLDSEGSARYDWPAGVFINMGLEAVFYIVPTGQPLQRTYVMIYRGGQ